MGKKKKAEAGLDSLPPLGMWKERCDEKKLLFTHGRNNAENSVIKDVASLPG